MNIFKRLFRNFNKNAQRKPRRIRDYVSPVDVSTQKESTSFASIDMIANAFSSLGYGVYDTDTHEKIKNHWLSNLVFEPNIEETHSLFMSQCVRDYFAGNVFLYKSRNENGDIVSLFRLNPCNVFVSRDLSDNRKIYTYNGQRFTDYEVLHIPSKYGYDGLRGRSIFDELSDTFRTAEKLNFYTANSFDNQLGERLIIDITDAFPDADDDTIEKVRDSYIDRYSGVKNAGKPIVKHGGIKFETIKTGTNDNKANELASNREFQNEQIAQIFHIPIDFLNGSAPQNIESSYTILTTQAVEPIATAFEEAFNRLLSEDERGECFFEFNYSSLMKTSLTTRIDAYAKQLSTGQLVLDEVRQMENHRVYGTNAAKTPLVASNLMPARDDIFDAYMAKAKETASKMFDSAASATDKNNFLNGDSGGIGDDRK